VSYSETYSDTYSDTYSVVDVEVVMRRVSADLVMIASSSRAITEIEAVNYAHDIELLAKRGFLKYVDVTLMNGASELKALRYEVNTESGALTTSRPGGVMWPRMDGAKLRIVLRYTDEYTAAEKEKMRPKLRINWTPTNVDTSHSSLSQSANRDYVSNAFGMRRKDFS
jgi:hypothetical protein